MKLNYLARGMLIASALAISSLVSGCGTDETSASAALQNSTLSQTNPVFAGDLEILLMNDFGALTTVTANPYQQYADTLTSLPAIGTNPNTYTITPVNTSSPATTTGIMNYTTVTFDSIPDQVLTNVTAPASTVFAGNLALTVSDTGQYAPSGNVNATISNAGSDMSTNVSAVAPPSVVWTAVMPDNSFAYEISGLQTFNQAVNVNAPAGMLSPALNIIANQIQPAIDVNGTLTLTTATSYSVNLQAPVLQRGFFGSNMLTGNKLTENGTFTAPPDSLPQIQLKNTGAQLYAAVHPSGSFLYVLGDRWDEGVFPTIPAGATPGSVALPPSEDGVAYCINGSSLGGPNGVLPIVNITNGAATVYFSAQSISTQRTRFERGYVEVYAIDRTSGHLHLIDAALLPAGFANPKYLTFGPNSTDLYISCYSASTNITATNSGIATGGGLVHYKLSQAQQTGTSGVATVVTGLLSNGSNAQTNDTVYSGRMPVESFNDLPRGALGMAFSQGFRHLYVACQLDGLPALNSVPTIPGAVGSIQAYDLNLNSLNLTRNTAAATPVGGYANGPLSYPGYIVANPVLDTLYVSSNGGSLNIQTDIGQARMINPSVAVGSTANVSVLQVYTNTGNSTSPANGTLIPGATIQDIVLAAHAAFQTVNVDPTGNIVFVCSGGSPVPYDLAQTSPGATAVETQSSFKGGMIAYQTGTASTNATTSLIAGIPNNYVVGTLTLLGGPQLGTPAYPVSSTLYLVKPQAPSSSGVISNSQ